MCLVALKCAEMCSPLCWISCIVNGVMAEFSLFSLMVYALLRKILCYLFVWTFFEENFVHEHFLSAIFYMFSNCALLLSAHSCVCVCVCVCAISSWHRHRRYVSLCQFVRPTLPCTGDVSICNDVMIISNSKEVMEFLCSGCSEPFWCSPFDLQDFEGTNPDIFTFFQDIAEIRHRWLFRTRPYSMSSQKFLYFFFKVKNNLVNKIDTASLEPWSTLLKMGPLLESFGAIVELVDNGVLGLL